MVKDISDTASSSCASPHPVTTHIEEQFEFSGFEGPEKRLQIDFCASGPSKKSLREITRESWQKVLDDAKCTILSVTTNTHFDAFVLSESSLFVFDERVMLKTCGTTTLLQCLSKLLETAASVQQRPRVVTFTHKNLNFPEKQLAPHSSFDDEVRFLNQHFEGVHQILGPMNDDHFNVYCARVSNNDATTTVAEPVLEVLMHDLDEEVMKHFFRSESFVSADQTTVESGIAALIPGSTIDAFMFSPCGYSMNGLKHQIYWTIHITPEKGHSYVSFEANSPLADHPRLLQAVLTTFKPARAVVAIYGEHCSTLKGPARISHDVSLATLESASAAAGFKTVYSASSTVPNVFDISAINVQMERPSMF